MSAVAIRRHLVSALFRSPVGTPVSRLASSSTTKKTPKTTKKKIDTSTAAASTATPAAGSPAKPASAAKPAAAKPAAAKPASSAKPAAAKPAAAKSASPPAAATSSSTVPEIVPTTVYSRDYQAPEYHKHHIYSYYDLENDLLSHRQEQPDCDGWHKQAAA